MPIIQPRVNFSNFSQSNPTADAINSIASVFQNNMANADNQKRQQLLDLQIQSAQGGIDAANAKAISEAQNAAALDAQVNNLADIFSPTLPEVLPAGVEGPVRPGMSVEQKLSDPANIGAINKAQFDLALKRGIKPQDVSNLLRSVAAVGKVRNEALQPFFAATGSKLGPNDALTVERQNQIRSENQANLLERDQMRPKSNNTFIMPDAMDSYINQQLPPILPGETIYNNLEKSTGPVSAGANIVANIAGAFGESMSPETIRTRQAAETFSTRLVSALRVSPRFPEGERKELKSIISLDPSVAKFPEVMKQRAISIDKTLENLERRTIADLRDPFISKTDKSSQASNLRTIREARRELGVPRDPKTGRLDDNTFSTYDAPQGNSNIPSGVDAGDWEYMTPEERALWQQ